MFRCLCRAEPFCAELMDGLGLQSFSTAEGRAGLFLSGSLIIRLKRVRITDQNGVGVGLGFVWRVWKLEVVVLFSKK
jgi:hypothetical protein